MNTAAIRTEYARWLELNDLLLHLGAVTDADSKSSALSTETPGQRLYAAVREWGDALVALRQSYPVSADPVGVGGTLADTWQKIGDVVEAEEPDTVEEELRRVLSAPGVPKAATDAARRAIHVLIARKRQIEWFRALAESRYQDAAKARKALLDAEREAHPPTVDNVRSGLHDLVAVLMKPDDARALSIFIDSAFHPEHDLGDEAWSRIDEAVGRGLADYDGPDGDDGRAFEDANGNPHYEP